MCAVRPFTPPAAAVLRRRQPPRSQYCPENALRDLQRLVRPKHSSSRYFVQKERIGPSADNASKHSISSGANRSTTSPLATCETLAIEPPEFVLAARLLLPHLGTSLGIRVVSPTRCFPNRLRPSCSRIAQRLGISLALRLNLFLGVETAYFGCS
jgi:hypothetical protein